MFSSSSRDSLERSADKFAILEARMQRPAQHANGAPSTPTVHDFSVGFSASRAELSNPGAEETSTSPSRWHAQHTNSTTPANGSFVASPAAAAASPVGGMAEGTAGKRKRSPTPPESAGARPADGATEPPRGPIGAALESAACQQSADLPQASGKRSAAAVAAAAPASKEGRSIHNYFPPKGGAVGAAKAAPPPSKAAVAVPSVGRAASAVPTVGPQPGAFEASSAELAAAQSQLAELTKRLAERSEQLAASTAALDDQRASRSREEEASGKLRLELDQAKIEAEACKSVISGMRSEVAEIRTEQEAEAERGQRGREALRAALRERCFRSRAEAKERLARESVRLGHLEPESRAFSSGYVQKEGSALRLVHERERTLELRKLTLEDDRKALRKRRAGNKASAAGAAAGLTSTDGSGLNGGGAESALLEACELADLEESLNLRASLISREKAELVAEKRQLEREATEHFHELKLMRELLALEDIAVTDGRIDLKDCPSLPHDKSCVHEPGAPPSAAISSQHRFVILDLIAQVGDACTCPV